MELKNDIQLKGTLKSVDQYLNIKLDDIQVVEELKYPHLVRRPFLQTIARVLLTVPEELRQECLHKRLGGALCASARGVGGHTAARGCNAERYASENGGSFGDGG